MKFIKSVYYLDRQVLSDPQETWEDLKATKCASEGPYRHTPVIWTEGVNNSIVTYFEFSSSIYI